MDQLRLLAATRQQEVYAYVSRDHGVDLTKCMPEEQLRLLNHVFGTDFTSTTEPLHCFIQWHAILRNRQAMEWNRRWKLPGPKIITGSRW